MNSRIHTDRDGVAELGNKDASVHVCVYDALILNLVIQTKERSGG